MKKRLLTIILSILLCIGVMPNKIYADDTVMSSEIDIRNYLPENIGDYLSNYEGEAQAATATIRNYISNLTHDTNQNIGSLWLRSPLFGSYNITDNTTINYDTPFEAGKTYDVSIVFTLNGIGGFKSFDYDDNNSYNGNVYPAPSKTIVGEYKSDCGVDPSTNVKNAIMICYRFTMSDKSEESETELSYIDSIDFSSKLSIPTYPQLETWENSKTSYEVTKEICGGEDFSDVGFDEFQILDMSFAGTDNEPIEFATDAPLLSYFKLDNTYKLWIHLYTSSSVNFGLDSNPTPIDISPIPDYVHRDGQSCYIVYEISPTEETIIDSINLSDKFIFPTYSQLQGYSDKTAHEVASIIYSNYNKNDRTSDFEDFTVEDVYFANDEGNVIPNEKLSSFTFEDDYSLYILLKAKENCEFATFDSIECTGVTPKPTFIESQNKVVLGKHADSQHYIFTNPGTTNDSYCVLLYNIVPGGEDTTETIPEFSVEGNMINYVNLKNSVPTLDNISDFVGKTISESPLGLLLNSNSSLVDNVIVSVNGANLKSETKFIMNDNSKFEGGNIYNVNVYIVCKDDYAFFNRSIIDNNNYCELVSPTTTDARIFFECVKAGDEYAGSSYGTGINKCLYVMYSLDLSEYSEDPAPTTQGTWSNLANVMSFETNNGVANEFTVSDESDVRTIKLLADFTATDSDSALLVPANKKVILDLNGHTLDRGLSNGNAIKYGNVIKVKGELTIDDTSDDKDGLITGANCMRYGDPYTDKDLLSYGGGIYVYAGEGNAKLILNGGTISGNNTSHFGGGIYALSLPNHTASIEMNGGTISNNNASNGGGIAVSNNGTSTDLLKIKGGSIINNYAIEYGAICTSNTDVYLNAAEGNTITITGNKVVTNTGAIGFYDGEKQYHFSGKVIIKDNIYTNNNNNSNYASNLILKVNETLPNRCVVIDGPLTDSEIYVDVIYSDNPLGGVITSGYKTNNPTSKANDFFHYEGPDDYAMLLTNNELEVKEYVTETVDINNSTTAKEDFNNALKKAEEEFKKGNPTKVEIDINTNIGSKDSPLEGVGVTSDTTIDLNGNDIYLKSLAVFGDLEDSSTENKGKIYVPQDQLSYPKPLEAKTNEETRQMPVWKHPAGEDGYYLVYEIAANTAWGSVGNVKWKPGEEKARFYVQPTAYTNITSEEGLYGKVYGTGGNVKAGIVLYPEIGGKQAPKIPYVFSEDLTNKWATDNPTVNGMYATIYGVKGCSNLKANAAVYLFVPSSEGSSNGTQTAEYFSPDSNAVN